MMATLEPTEQTSISALVRKPEGRISFQEYEIKRARIMKLHSEGKKAGEIAAELGLAPRTTADKIKRWSSPENTQQSMDPSRNASLNAPAHGTARLQQNQQMGMISMATSSTPSGPSIATECKHCGAIINDSALQNTYYDDREQKRPRTEEHDLAEVEAYNRSYHSHTPTADSIDSGYGGLERLSVHREMDSN